MSASPAPTVTKSWLVKSLPHARRSHTAPTVLATCLQRNAVGVRSQSPVSTHEVTHSVFSISMRHLTNEKKHWTIRKKWFVDLKCYYRLKATFSWHAASNSLKITKRFHTLRYIKLRLCWYYINIVYVTNCYSSLIAERTWFLRGF